MFLLIIVIFIIYCLAGFGFCVVVKGHMIEFMLLMSIDADAIQEAVAGVQLEAAQPKQESEKKEKKAVEIPEFLFKYSSTFFKTATKKDILFKKLFNNKGLKKLDKGSSARQDFDSAKDSSPMAGKTLKKTDMSMINFHLNVKDNQDLLKHYR